MAKNNIANPFVMGYNLKFALISNFNISYEKQQFFKRFKKLEAILVIYSKTHQ